MEPFLKVLARMLCLFHLLLGELLWFGTFGEEFRFPLLVHYSTEKGLTPVVLFLALLLPVLVNHQFTLKVLGIDVMVMLVMPSMLLVMLLLFQCATTSKLSRAVDHSC